MCRAYTYYNGIHLSTKNYYTYRNKIEEIITKFDGNVCIKVEKFSETWNLLPQAFVVNVEYDRNSIFHIKN